jgi:integration host factor subunit beta
MPGSTVTKKDLVLRIADATGQPQSIARDLVQRFIDEIIVELAQGNRVELRDFGVFEVRVRRGRRARNPKTGAPIDVPSKRSVIIKAGKKMKDQIGIESGDSSRIDVILSGDHPETGDE